MLMKIRLTIVSLLVSVGVLASETSVKNEQGVEIWYDFDAEAKTASVTYKGSNFYSYDNEYTGEVVIPSTVTYEGEKYSVTSIGDDAFRSCDALTSITIPEGVTSIGEWTFGYCTALTSITLPEGLTSIGKSAFSNCSALTSITLPEGVTSIGNYAFYYCTALTSITLSEGVTSIGNYAFSNCDALTSITLPESLTSIGNSAFYYCDSLTSITSKNTTPPTIGSSNTFYDVDKSIPVYVPKSSVDAYKSAEYWKDFTNIVGAYFVDVIAENGTVEGAGAYEENAEATLTVTPAEGYKFVKWSDGVTDNPRTVVVVSDTTFTAEFEIKEYTLTTEAENGTVEGAGTYKHGDEATLTATPIVGYIFTKWSDGVTDNPRTVVVVSDTTLTAEFEIDNTPISDIQTSDVNVRLIGNEIVVEVADDYTVYSINGQNLGKVERVERGIYIVVVNGKSYKVIAK